MSLIIALGLIALAFWQRSNLLHIIGGFVVICLGIYQLTMDVSFIYIVESVALICVGLYMLIMVGVEYIQSSRKGG